LDAFAGLFARFLDAVAHFIRSFPDLLKAFDGLIRLDLRLDLRFAVVTHGRLGTRVGSHLFKGCALKDSDGIKGVAPVFGAHLLGIEQAKQGAVIQPRGAIHGDAPLRGD
jgi:hypothetical protein